MPDGGTLTIESFNIRIDEKSLTPIEEVEPGEYVMLAGDTGTGIAPGNSPACLSLSIRPSRAAARD